ncbi:MAG: twin-arginine translocation pathway signal protein [Burkholderiales bacterium]|nr:twin-arginine translocation pathway signal protein [Burkholderiales bacterium]
MDRRNFIRLAGGGVLVAAGVGSLGGCASFTAFPAEAVEAWSGPGSAERDPRRRAVAYAITAPNPHNMQPWIVDLREANAITLYCDRDRLLADSDPFGRQILVGHGCFLELLVQALGDQGIGARVTLWPQGALPQPLAQWDQRPVARVELAGQGQRDPLFAHVLARRTARWGYDMSKPISADVLRTLSSTAQSNAVAAGGTVEAAQVQRLRDIAREAGLLDKKVPRVVIETLGKLRIGSAEIMAHRDGVALTNFLARFADTFGMLDRKAVPAPGSPADKQMTEMYVTTTQETMGWIWLTTAGNRRDQQVEAGRAFVRLQLKATELGIGVHPMSQALQEYPEMAAHYTAVHRAVLNRDAPRSESDATVQMLCRIGYTTEPTPAAPRRALASVIRA